MLEKCKNALQELCLTGYECYKEAIGLKTGGIKVTEKGWVYSVYTPKVLKQVLKNIPQYLKETFPFLSQLFIAFYENTFYYSTSKEIVQAKIKDCYPVINIGSVPYKWRFTFISPSEVPEVEEANEFSGLTETLLKELKPITYVTTDVFILLNKESGEKGTVIISDGYHDFVVFYEDRKVKKIKVHHEKEEKEYDVSNQYVTFEINVYYDKAVITLIPE